MLKIHENIPGKISWYSRMNTWVWQSDGEQGAFPSLTLGRQSYKPEGALHPLLLAFLAPSPALLHPVLQGLSAGMEMDRTWRQYSVWGRAFRKDASESAWSLWGSKGKMLMGNNNSPEFQWVWIGSWLCHALSIPAERKGWMESEVICHYPSLDLSCPISK